MHKILVVDDEDSVRYSLKKLLRDVSYQVLEASSGEAALAIAASELPHLIILDIQMPGESGLEILPRLKQVAPRTPVLMITAYTTSDRVIAAIKHGAFDFIEKPFDIPRLRTMISEALAVGQAMQTEVLLGPEVKPHLDADRIVGNSLVIQDVCKMIGRVAASDISVLIRGESGTGKELVARAIYHHSQRSGKPFIAVNCAAIPETLLESELFGYEKGAFTGASRRKIGKFELADNGVIFLDEIGDMSMATQAKLLRVLQDGTIERLGGEETIRVDVRVIAATNQNLEQAIIEKRFREDLYYRIKVITITLPPLRLRKEDLPDLVQYFLAKHSAQLQKSRIAVAPEAMSILANHDWPGNIRELENAIKRAILFCQGTVITPEIFQQDLQAITAETPATSGNRLSLFISGDLENYQGRLYETVMSELERDVIVAVLNHVGGNQVRAAQLLGISRVMLHDRIEKYGIKKEVTVQQA